MERNKTVDWAALNDVILGCANQAGEDNRNVARMACFWPDCLKPFPASRSTVYADRAWKPRPAPPAPSAAGEADLLIAGGVESMSRAPFVMAKAAEAFAREPRLHDTTMGWRLFQ